MPACLKKRECKAKQESEASLRKKPQKEEAGYPPKKNTTCYHLPRWRMLACLKKRRMKAKESKECVKRSKKAKQACVRSPKKRRQGTQKKHHLLPPAKVKDARVLEKRRKVKAKESKECAKRSKKAKQACVRSPKQLAVDATLVSSLPARGNQGHGRTEDVAWWLWTWKCRACEATRPPISPASHSKQRPLSLWCVSGRPSLPMPRCRSFFFGCQWFDWCSLHRVVADRVPVMSLEELEKIIKADHGSAKAPQGGGGWDVLAASLVPCWYSSPPLDSTAEKGAPEASVGLGCLGETAPECIRCQPSQSWVSSISSWHLLVQDWDGWP